MRDETHERDTNEPPARTLCERPRARHGAPDPVPGPEESEHAWRERTRRRGLTMAMRAAALVVSAGASVGALGASAGSPAPARADEGSPSTSPQSGPSSPSSPDEPRTGASVDDAERADPSEPGRVRGYSCLGPISRGPLAPPAQAPEDFAELLSRVPA
jgi:hypothetical protein